MPVISEGERLYREVRQFVNGSAAGLLQLLVAAAQRPTFERIIACPTYPVPTRMSGLSAAVRQFHEAALRPDVHLPTFLARLYSSARPLRQRKRLGQFFTAAEAADWALSVAPPASTDDICDAGSGTAVFASAILRAERTVRSYTGVESDAILTLCGAHVLDNLKAPGTFRIWYANFLSLQHTAFQANGVGAPTLIVANPPYIRFHNLAGRARLLAALKSSLGITLSSFSGSVSYFLLRAAELASREDAQRLDRPTARLLFFVPKEAAGAAHARRLREDLQRVQGWECLQYTIPTERTSVEHRSNALALFFVFEHKKLWVNPHVVRPKPAVCVGTFLRVKRGISTGCNEFFVLNDEDIRRLNIPLHHLRPVLPTRVPIRGSSFTRADWNALRESGHRCWLLALPSADLQDFGSSVREYLKDGLRRGLHATPTAQRLRTWFSIPIPREPADVLVTYLFRDTPHFALNEARVLHLTNILGGWFVPTVVDREYQKTVIAALNDQARGWMEADLVGREYRGGLRKVEPRELSMLPVDSIVGGLVNAQSGDLHLQVPASLFG